MNNKAALYVRVSTYHQIDKDSLPFQRQELSNYAKYVLGIDDFEIFEDAGYSAKNTDRPKFQEMMSRMRSGEFSHILVWKLDRISRNLKDFTEMYEELTKYKITFISKNEQFDTSCAMGEAMLKIILVFAELERKITAERVKSIMLDRAQKGLWNGASVPIGYIWSSENKFPIIDKDESEIVQYIYNLYETKSSTSKVAFQLNLENVKTKRGGKWTAKTVNDILRNPFYTGTYRYNVKTQGTRRWKDESEWIVVEDNHPGFISKEQFDRVNAMLSANFKGVGSFQREHSNTHIFSKMLICGKCGNVLKAGLDSPRKDGYRPSRYTCSNLFVDSISSCNNFVSDITLLPFILNYIANFINLQGNITPNNSLRDIEKILLRGNAFVDVSAIDRKGLEETYLVFAMGFPDQTYSDDANVEDNSNFELESLKKEKIKYEKALIRLEDLFLFADEAMAEKDFLFKKRDIVQHIENINTQLSDLHKRNTDMKLTTDIVFLTKASHFLISQEISNKKNIDYRALIDTVDTKLIQDFVGTVIKEIVIVDKKILSIKFNNGISHNFLYKPKEDCKIRTREKFLYREYETILIDYLKENKSLVRTDVEKITGMGRASATAILNEFMDRGLIEKKGNSIAIRYFLIENKTTLDN